MKFKITTNFDGRKIAKELEKKALLNVEKQVQAKLSDLIAQGLKVSILKGNGSKLDIHIDGPEELIKTAKQRLN